MTTVGFTLGRVMVRKTALTAAWPQGRVDPIPTRPFPNAAASFWPESNLFFGSAETSAITLQRQQARQKCSGNRRKAGVLRERTPLEPDVETLRTPATTPSRGHIKNHTATCQRQNIAAPVGSYADRSPQMRRENRVVTEWNSEGFSILKLCLSVSVSSPFVGIAEKLRFCS